MYYETSKEYSCFERREGVIGKSDFIGNSVVLRPARNTIPSRTKTSAYNRKMRLRDANTMSHNFHLYFHLPMHSWYINDCHTDTV